MGLRELLELSGGAALFIYGKQVLSRGLETALEMKMKQILEQLTANRFLGMSVSAVLTAVLQSSATIVMMVAGFVSSGMMTLQQAVWAILGANIGACVTAQLLALEPEAALPLFFIAGLMLMMVLKKYNCAYMGESVIGFGLFFLGMHVVKETVLPLHSFPYFAGWMKLCSHPLAGILTGMMLAVLLRSSGTAVGMLQALAAGGLIGIEGAVFVLLGQNAGEALEVLWANRRGTTEGKQAASLHLLFHMTGTLLFVLMSLTLPLAPALELLTPGRPAGQVANANTLFLVGTALLFLPAGSVLVEMIEKLIPVTVQEKQKAETYLKYLPSGVHVTETGIGNSVIYFRQLRQEILHMLSLAQENVDQALWAFRMKDTEPFLEIAAAQTCISCLNQEISESISGAFLRESSEKNIFMAYQYFQITQNAERIGAHTLKIAGYIAALKEKDLSFSRDAYREMEQMEQVIHVLFETLEKEEQEGWNRIKRISRLECDIIHMAAQFRANHIERIRLGICPREACGTYLEMLMDFEGIGQYALEIARKLMELDGTSA